MYETHAELKSRFKRGTTWMWQFSKDFREYADAHPKKMKPVVVAYNGTHRMRTYNVHAAVWFYEWRELLMNNNRQVPTLEEDWERISKIIGH